MTSKAFNFRRVCKIERDVYVLLQANVLMGLHRFSYLVNGCEKILYVLFGFHDDAHRDCGESRTIHPLQTRKV